MSDNQGRTARRRGRRFLRLAATALSAAAVIAFAQEALPKGIGPVTAVELGEVDEGMAAAGRATFESLCSACHKFGERYVGPDFLGVTERRSPEWIMNMVLNTEQMIFEDDTAYELLAEYMTPMPQLPLTEQQVRELLEFFRLQDAQAGN